MMLLTCCARSKIEPPPPEVCGYWFENALSIERRFGTSPGRRKYGCGEPEGDRFAWAIIDEETRMLEWSAGIEGSSEADQAFKGKVNEWGHSAWRCHSGPVLEIEDKEYTELSGWKLLTRMRVNDRELHRAVAAVADDMPIYIFLGEARALGWEESCLEAVLQEQQRYTAKQAPSRGWRLKPDPAG